MAICRFLRPFLQICLFLAAAAHGYDPFENEAPLGSATGCEVHKLAFEYAQSLLPALLPANSARLAAVWDSLFTGTMTSEGMGTCGQTPPSQRDPPAAPTHPLPTDLPLYFADFDHGDDNAVGTVSAPVKTIVQAIALARSQHAGQPRWVVLRAGIHFLGQQAIKLGPDDSYLTIANFPGEKASISGGYLLQPNPSHLWKPYTPPWMANLTTCPDKCAAVGHCCIGDTSSYQHPSCTMGCTMGSQTTSREHCIAQCDAADKAGCSYQSGNHTFNLCGTCPFGCNTADGVAECHRGCGFAYGEPVLNIIERELNEIPPTARVFGVHAIQPDQLSHAKWETVLPRARFPNKVASAGTVEAGWARLANHSWRARPWAGFGHQVCRNYY